MPEKTPVVASVMAQIKAKRKEDVQEERDEYKEMMALGAQALIDGVKDENPKKIVDAFLAMLEVEREMPYCSEPEVL